MNCDLCYGVPMKTLLTPPLLCLFLLFGLNSAFSSEVKILSWNIYQIPKPFLWTKQGIRAKAIGEDLKKTDFDIIFFQEAFAPSVRKKIYDRIGETYPYESGTFKKKKFGTILNSGLWAVSRYPVKALEHIYYPTCKGMDCFATKGALLVEVTLPNKKIQVLGTHLQANDDDGRAEIRAHQLEMIKNLLDKHQKAGVEQIILGDLNIDFYTSTHYSELLNLLNALDCELTGDFIYSAGEITNSYSAKKKKRELLDYVLIRDAASTGAYFKHKILYKRVINHKGKDLDLSDHYGVEAVIEIPD